MKKTLSLGLFAILMSAGISRADVVRTVTSSGDGVYGRQYDGSGNYYFWASGSSTNTASYYYAYYGGSSRWLESYTTYLQINIAGLPAVDQIQSVVFSIYVKSNTPQTYTNKSALIYLAANPSTATGDPTQRIGGNLIYTMTSADGTGWVNIDVTTQMLSNLSQGNKWAAFSLAGDSGSSGDRSGGITFASGADASYAPQLTFTLVPEPLSVGILGVGCLAMLLKKKTC